MRFWRFVKEETDKNGQQREEKQQENQREQETDSQNETLKQESQTEQEGSSEENHLEVEQSQEINGNSSNGTTEETSSIEKANDSEQVEQEKTQEQPRETQGGNTGEQSGDMLKENQVQPIEGQNEILEQENKTDQEGNSQENQLETEQLQETNGNSSNGTTEETSSIEKANDSEQDEQEKTQEQPRETQSGNTGEQSRDMLKESQVQPIEGQNETLNQENQRELELSQETKENPSDDETQQIPNEEKTDSDVQGECQEQLEETNNKSLKDREKQLQEIKNKLLEYAIKKKEQDEYKRQILEKYLLNKQKGTTTESKEENYELSEQTNKFLEQLNELPSFKDRDRGPGYSIDTESYTELPDSMIRTLITKFLNQRFCKHTTDLNIRSNSLEKSKGFYKWEIKDVITHLKTHQITKVLNDKYGYQYANGKKENVPLSFYFDMSGSMSEYTNMLAVIAIELLKKNVKVLIGFNEKVNVQIENINRNISIPELASILESAGYWAGMGRDNFKKDSRVSYKYIERNLDNYLISKSAEKCVVFSDFDPIDEVINLSRSVEVYWFCFEEKFTRDDLNKFNGFIYKVRNTTDIMEGLIKVNTNRFEALCYTENQKTLQKTLGGK